MLNAVNVRNQTPLMIAVQTGIEEIVQAIVDITSDEVRVTVSRYPGRPVPVRPRRKRVPSVHPVDSDFLGLSGPECVPSG